MIDSHCHLFFDKLKNNLPIIVNRAKEKNITSILSINTKLEEFNDHLNLIENYDSIFISCGVHPENITENNIPKVEDIVSFCSKKKVIGIFGIINIDFSDNSCEIAYGVSSKYLERGIATQVTSYILNVVFEKLKFNRIYSITHEKNIAHIKMLKKCNFVKEKVIKSSFVKNNIISDNLLFSIVQNK